MLRLGLVAAMALWTADGQAQLPAPEPVTLKFCWAPGLKAQVTTSSFRTQTGVPDRRSTFRYSLSVVQQDQHLRIRSDSPVADLSGAGQQVSPELQARVDDQLEQMLPDFLVTPDGKLVGLADFPAYQARLRAMIGQRVPKGVDAAAAEKAIAAATTEAVLNTRLAQQWQVLVGAWNGGTLPVGVEQKRQSKVGPADKPGLVVNHTFSATKRLPCQRGGVERQCVELDLRSTPDPAGVNARVGQIAAALGRKLTPTSRPKAAAIEERVQLIAEIECLVPHSFERTHAQALVLNHGDREETVKRVERSAVTYAYE
jgi:hypothetical protein